VKGCGGRQMNYKLPQWDHVDISHLAKFGTEVPVYSPSVYREYRGEIFTTFQSETHPVMKLLPNDVSIHGRFSKSYQGVLRGLHYDNKTWKLVQALVGDIYLVVMDVRENSSTYGKWESYVISESTRDQVLIPPGFANGHYALTDCIFHYNLFYQGEYVDEKAQGVIKWNDSRFNIEWPTDKPVLQARDR
jgi:dTDP-4-dehydrorhamnose 3,5-epimerase